MAHAFKDAVEVRAFLDKFAQEHEGSGTGASAGQLATLAVAMRKLADEMLDCQKQMSDCHSRMRDCQNRMSDCEKQMVECQKQMGK